MERSRRAGGHVGCGETRRRPAPVGGTCRGEEEGGGELRSIVPAAAASPDSGLELRQSPGDRAPAPLGSGGPSTRERAEANMERKQKGEKGEAGGIKTFGTVSTRADPFLCGIEQYVQCPSVEMVITKVLTVFRLPNVFLRIVK